MAEAYGKVSFDHVQFSITDFRGKFLFKCVTCYHKNNWNLFCRAFHLLLFGSFLGMWHWGFLHLSKELAVYRSIDDMFRCIPGPSGTRRQLLYEVSTSDNKQIKTTHFVHRIEQLGYAGSGNWFRMYGNLQSQARRAKRWRSNVEKERRKSSQFAGISRSWICSSNFWTLYFIHRPQIGEGFSLEAGLNLKLREGFVMYVESWIEVSWH